MRPLDLQQAEPLLHKDPRMQHFTQFAQQRGAQRAAAAAVLDRVSLRPGAPVEQLAEHLASVRRKLVLAAQTSAAAR